MLYSASLVIDCSLHMLNVLNIYEYEGYYNTLANHIRKRGIQRLSSWGYNLNELIDTTYFEKFHEKRVSEDKTC